MLSTTDDLRIRELKELSTPEQVMREVPRTLTATRVVMAARNAIHAILSGLDGRARGWQPEAWRACLGSLLPGRLQDPRRRQCPHRGGWGAIGVASGSFHRGEQGRTLSDCGHGRQRGLPHRPARRQPAEL